MARIDLHKLALRWKVIEMLQRYLRQRELQEAHLIWYRLIRPN